MILKEFTTHKGSRLEKLSRALNENYGYEIDFDGMTPVRATNIIDRAKTRIEESRDVNNRIKLGLIVESLELWMQANVQTELTDMVAEALDDDSVDEAKVIIAAQEISDNIQKMIEDVAEMQVQDLLPIVDAMKSEIGSAEAESFSDAADAALSTLLDALKSAKEEYSNAISIAQGDAPATDMDDFGGDEGDEMDMDVDLSMEPEGDIEGADEFGGDDTEIAGSEPTGREMKDEA